MSVEKNRKPASTMKRKSIRLQIELPIEESDSDSDQIKQQYTPVNKIHLRISIDQNSAKKSTNLKSKARKQINFSDKSTSGYSSSASSSLTESVHDYSFLNDFEENAFLHADDSGFMASSLKRKRDYSDENLYDRLLHSNTKLKVSKKIYKSNEFLSSSTAYDFLSENSNESNDNIYEEISNFIETNPIVKREDRSSSHFYENVENVKNDLKRVYYNESSVVRHKKSAKFCYKREYTVNEIFDNLKKFKKQAKEQEILTNSAKKCSNLYENNQVSKPIYV